MSIEKNEIIYTTVPDGNTPHRVDHFLSELESGRYSRSFIQRLAREGNIRVNGIAVKPSFTIRAGDTLEMEIPKSTESAIEARDIPLEIVYEDESLTVINKSPGMTVHPGSGTKDDTLVHALLFHYDGLSSIGGVERPGIVHRLDRDTSGLMVIAKNDATHISLSKQFADRTIEKEYCALVTGNVKKDHFSIDSPIGRHPVHRNKMTVRPDGREAITEVFVEEKIVTPRDTFSLLRVKIHTGRTHQIRVHLSAAGHPIVGDPLYSRSAKRFDTTYLLLASVHLSFDHPATGERLSFTIDLPPHMQQFIDKSRLSARPCDTDGDAMQIPVR